jgi:hypothetical protein
LSTEQAHLEEHTLHDGRYQPQSGQAETVPGKLDLMFFFGFNVRGGSRIACWKRWGAQGKLCRLQAYVRG